MSLSTQSLILGTNLISGDNNNGLIINGINLTGNLSINSGLFIQSGQIGAFGNLISTIPNGALVKGYNYLVANDYPTSYEIFPAPNILYQDFEAGVIPYGWYGPGINFAYQPPLNGEYSCYISGGLTCYTQSFSSGYAGYIDYTGLYVFLMIQINEYPSSYSDVLSIYNQGSTEQLASIAIFGEQLYTVGGTGIVRVANSVPTGIPFYIWMSTQISTSGNQINTIAFSTGLSQPTNGNNFAQFTNGTATGIPYNIFLGSVDSDLNMVIDHLGVSSTNSMSTGWGTDIQQNSKWYIAGEPPDLNDFPLSSSSSYSTVSGMLVLKYTGTSLNLISIPLDFSSTNNIPLLAGNQGFYVQCTYFLSNNNADHWPAFWLMPWEQNNFTPPSDIYPPNTGNSISGYFQQWMELDVNEGGFLIGTANTVHFWSGYSYLTPTQISNPNNQNLISGFNQTQPHTYGVSYDPILQQVSWWLDGNYLSSANSPYVPSVATGQHFYLILSAYSHGQNVSYNMYVSNIEVYQNYSGAIPLGNYFINTGQTGNFTSTINLNTTGNTLQNEINLINNVTGTFVQTGNTGSFITNSQTGAFGSTINLFNTGNSLAIWTGQSTGFYYPLTSNPSGFITTGQTGAFVGDSFNTGTLSGVFALLTGGNNFSGTQILFLGNLTGLPLSGNNNNGIGMLLGNPTLATTGNGGIQISPSLNFSGTYYATGNNFTGTIPMIWRIYVTGTSGVLGSNMINPQLNFDLSSGFGSFLSTINFSYQNSNNSSLLTINNVSASNSIIAPIVEATTELLTNTINPLTNTSSLTINNNKIQTTLQNSITLTPSLYSIVSGTTGNVSSLIISSSNNSSQANVNYTYINISPNYQFSGLQSGTGYNLRINSTSPQLSGLKHYLFDVSNSGNSAFCILSSGNLSGNGSLNATGFIGINNSNPQYHFDVSGNINTNSNLTVSGSGNFFSGLAVSGVPVIVGISGAIPTTGSLLLPATADIFGGSSALLGTPAGWISFTAGTITGRIPYY